MVWQCYKMFGVDQVELTIIVQFELSVLNCGNSEGELVDIEVVQFVQDVNDNIYLYRVFCGKFGFK